MKIRSVKINNRKKAFEVRTHSKVLVFPLGNSTRLPPTSTNTASCGPDAAMESLPGVSSRQ